MYACMERAGPQVASALLSAGADPSMEDHSGASALVYAVNTKHQQTLKVGREEERTIKSKSIRVTDDGRRNRKDVKTLEEKMIYCPLS